MNITDFIPGKALLYLGLAAAAVAGYAYWAHVQQEKGAAENEQVHAKEAFKEGERQLAKQQTLIAAKAAVEKKYAQAKNEAAVAGAARDAAQQRLRNELAQRGQPGGDPTTCRGVDGDPRDCIIAQCSSALGRLDGAVKNVANQVSGLQGYAREVCLAAND